MEARVQTKITVFFIIFIYYYPIFSQFWEFWVKYNSITIKEKKNSL